MGAKQRKNSATVFVIRNGFLGGVYSVFFFFSFFVIYLKSIANCGTEGGL